MREKGVGREWSERVRYAREWDKEKTWEKEEQKRNMRREVLTRNEEK